MATDPFDGFFRGKRVLVTGHTGFKGGWLAQWLRGLGAVVAGFSDIVRPKPCLFEAINLGDRVETHLGDVGDARALEAAFDRFRPEIVFHLAAQALVREAYDRPSETFSTNLLGTVNVLDTVRRSSSVTTAVIITSDKCYENVEWVHGYRENDRLGGSDPYSASKACAEIAFSAYHRSFFSGRKAPRIASTRAGNVIGGGDWAKDRIFPDCVRAWSDGRSATIRNPHATRPWQHVLEPLSGYLWLAARLADPGSNLAGESFNFGPAASVTESVAELIDEAAKSWPAATWHRTEETDGARKEASLLKLSCDKALLELGWQPTLSFAEAVAMTAGWYRAYFEKKTDMADFTTEQIRSFESRAREAKAKWMGR